MGGGPGEQRVGIHGASVHGGKQQQHFLFSDLRGDADNGAALDVRVPGEDVLHLPGRHVLTPYSNAVASATAEVQASAAVPFSAVAGAEPGAVSGTFGGFVVVQVASGQQAGDLPADEDLGDLPRFGRPLANEAHVEPGQRCSQPWSGFPRLTVAMLEVSVMP